MHAFAPVAREVGIELRTVQAVGRHVLTRIENYFQVGCVDVIVGRPVVQAQFSLELAVFEKVLAQESFEYVVELTEAVGLVQLLEVETYVGRERALDLVQVGDRVDFDGYWSLLALVKGVRYKHFGRADVKRLARFICTVAGLFVAQALVRTPSACVCIF